jgi:hypothetical protein
LGWFAVCTVSRAQASSLTAKQLARFTKQFFGAVSDSQNVDDDRFDHGFDNRVAVSRWGDNSGLDLPILYYVKSDLRISRLRVIAFFEHTLGTPDKATCAFLVYEYFFEHKLDSVAIS